MAASAVELWWFKPLFFLDPFWQSVVVEDMFISFMGAAGEEGMGGAELRVEAWLLHSTSLKPELDDDIGTQGSKCKAKEINDNEDNWAKLNREKLLSLTQ